ncbi:MAG: nickel-dependent hydrogenase large subunit [Desulfobacteraceae bacterium]|nr:nickel-dependent hydrogenase large subunit [Desulfobacteraceae bacterium]
MPETTKITIDPVTRIEGHLKIEVEITDGRVTNAWSSGTLFRGVETILQGREPEDAWLFTQRLCGVCTYVHGVSSVRCVEDAAGVSIPDNARIIRNLLMGGLYIHDHPVHFYHLHALDWVDIVSALSANPGAAKILADTISPSAPTIDFEEVQTKLRTFVNSGQLGPFAGGYWGHSAYQLTPEENLIYAAHYLYALREQVKAAKMHAIFGAKNPHLQSLRVGGVTCEKQVTSTRINEFKTYLNQLKDFIDHVYLPDVKYLASKYPEWASIGGFNNYLAFGEFQNGNSPWDNYLPGGVILNGNLAEVNDVDLSKISEHVERSFYAGTSARHPASGETIPNYTGYDTKDRYSWLKAPRYNGEPMEVGPLARVLTAYAKGHTDMVKLVDELLTQLDLTMDNMHSTLGRVAARALETKLIADQMDNWLSQLNTGGSFIVSPDIPTTGAGAALNEAPRGALGHWINIDDRKIANYQMVVPSTWNLGPRCSAGKKGPVEEALMGTMVVNPEEPVEILRIIHSYDPCLACAVHIIDTNQDKTYTVQVIK